MATGYPRLTIFPTNGSAILTTYELQPDGFVQIAAVNFSPSDNIIRSMEYVLDSDILTIVYRINTLEVHSVVYKDRYLTTLSSGPANTGSLGFIFKEVKIEDNLGLGDVGKVCFSTLTSVSNTFSRLFGYQNQFDSSTLINAYNIADEGGGDSHSILDYTSSRTSAIHPSLDFVFIATNTGGLITTNKTTFPITILGIAVNVPEYIRGTNVPVAQAEVTDTTISRAEWSPDGKYLYTLNATNELAVYELAETPVDVEHTLIRRFSVQLSADSYQKITVRPDNRYIAVSTLTGSIYRTIIFERMGYVLKQLQSITNMGRALNWTADGKYLIDATNKRCYYYDVIDNDFKEDIHLMDNIPTGATVQAISTHIPPNTGTGLIYSISIPDLIEGNVDFDNLRFALLNDTAIFDPDDESLNMLASVATGTLAVGELVANVNIGVAAKTGAYAVTADPIDFKVDVATSFRFGFLYDDTSNTPIAFYDFGETKSTEKSVTIRVSVADFGLITVSN